MRYYRYLILSCLLFSCDTSADTTTDLPKSNICDTVVIVEYRTDTVFVAKEDLPKTPEFNLEEEFEEVSDFYVMSRLPEWFVELGLLQQLKLEEVYLFDDRLNLLYLEADFDGDGHLDIALPIKHIQNKKRGFAIIHGQTAEIHIIGAGIKISNGLSDDLNSADIWKVNRKKVNQPGLDETTGNGEKGALLLDLPSLQIETAEIGGGLIYWNGKEYVYFHQAC